MLVPALAFLLLQTGPPPAPSDPRIHEIAGAASLAWATAPQWERSRFVGKKREHTFENLVIDNYFFGVAAVSTDGNESVVVFPEGTIPRERR